MSLQLDSKPQPLSSKKNTQPFRQTNFRFRASFEQGGPRYSGNCRVWIHSETLTRHDKNIQSYFMVASISNRIDLRNINNFHGGSTTDWLKESGK